MTTIEQYFMQAELAQAAYGTFQKGAITTSQLTNDKVGMTAAQAKAFTEKWEVVHHLPDTASGFSATVFERLNEEGELTGERYLAIRGSTDWADVRTDIGDIVLDGIALDQLVDMYNYWQSLSAEKDKSYDAVRLTEVTAETEALKAAWQSNSGLAYEAALWQMGYIIDRPTNTVLKIETVDSSQLSNASLQTGLGAISGTTKVDVSGHSLGGHLAMAFSRLFPDVTKSAVVVNSLGFNFNIGNVDNLFAALNGAAGFDVNKITHVVGSAGPNVAAQDWYLQQPAGHTEIFTESWGWSTKIGHGIYDSDGKGMVIGNFHSIEGNEKMEAFGG